MAIMFSVVRALAGGWIARGLLTRLARESAPIILLSACAMMFFTVAIGLIAFQAAQYLSPRYSPQEAALLVAAALGTLGLAACVAVIAILRRRASEASALLLAEATAVEAIPRVREAGRRLANRAPTLATLGFCAGVMTGLVLLGRR